MPRFAWFAKIKEKTPKKKKTRSPSFLSRLTTRKPGGSWVDPHESRDPVPDATTLTFPSDMHFEGSRWSSDTPPPDLQALFAKIVRPGDIHHDHANALNINVLEKCDIEEMIPKAKDGISYLPSLDDDADPARTFLTTYAEAAKSDGETTRKRKDFTDRLAELRVDNDAAFRGINKVPLIEGGRHPRLAHMRKFWEGVENMSRYWDSSMDNYYTPELNQDEQSRVKRQRTDNGASSPLTTRATSPLSNTPRSSVEFGSINNNRAEHDSAPMPNASSSPLHSSSVQKSIEELARNASFTPPRSPVREGEPEMTGETATQPEHATTTLTIQTDHPEPQTDLNAESQAALIPDSQSRMRYRGRRTSAGSKMPDTFRASAVTGFLEGVVWAFGCSVSTPRVMPRIQIGKLNVPVRQTAAVYRIPSDKAKARKGRREGPIIAMQTRPETDFQQDDPKASMATVRLDLLREIGALLQLAQERHREGKTEVKPGEGEWWTTKPRWGGGPGGDAQNDVGNTDVVESPVEIADSDTKDVPIISLRRRSKSSKKQTPAELWKELKCGAGIWDQKIDYEAIGKDPHSPYDEVFLVSSINHHIAILKMTVHAAYLDYLVSGVLPEPLPTDYEWCRPKLQRSQWFDVFKLEDRCMVFQGLWGIMCYLTRETAAGSS